MRDTVASVVRPGASHHCDAPRGAMLDLVQGPRGTGPGSGAALVALLTLPGIESFLIGECRACGVPAGAVGDGWVEVLGDPAPLLAAAGTLRAVLEVAWRGPAAAIPARLPVAQRLWCEGQWINRGRECAAAFAAAARASGAAEVLRAPEGPPGMVCVVDRGGQALIGSASQWGIERRRPYRLALMARSLNPAMARAVVMASRARAGDAFLDPFCGSGTLLAERALLGPCRLIGVDREAGAVDAAGRALSGFLLAGERGAALPGPEVDLRVGDARALPLADGSISAVATNPPYGHRLGSVAANAELYAAALREAARVLGPRGRLVVLSGDRRHLRQALRACGPALRTRSETRVWLGGLEPLLGVYDRTEATLP